MHMPKRRRYLRGWLLLGLLWGGACTGVQDSIDRTRHYFDKTETDLEYGRPEAASSFHRPRGVQRYGHDETEVDLAGSRPPQAQQETPTGPAPSEPDTPPAAPLPGGSR
jgi:hypothetical protein